MAVFTPLPVEPVFFDWRGYQIAVYQAGPVGSTARRDLAESTENGDSIVLVHSINAAASAFEMRGPFHGLQATHEVRALDLLGYGRSDRPERRYRAQDYIDLLVDLVRRIDKPTTLVGNTLGAAYVIGAAARLPRLVKSLVLVCPTGIEILANPPGPAQALQYSFWRGPVGARLFELLVTRPSIRYFLTSMSYATPDQVTPEVIDAFYQTAQQPGARFAPICFVSGLLNYDVRKAFASLKQPIQLVWGGKATTTKLSQAQAFLQLNAQARLEVFEECGMIVQDEAPERFTTLVQDFLHANNMKPSS